MYRSASRTERGAAALAAACLVAACLVAGWLGAAIPVHGQERVTTPVAQAPPAPASDAPAADASEAPASEAPAPSVGLAAALQPGLGSGDFEFHVDAVALRPAAAGRTVVRVTTQLPLRSFFEISKADRAELRLRVRAFEAGAAMQRLATHETTLGTLQGDTLRAELARTDRDVERLLTDFEGVQTQGDVETRVRVEADRAKLTDSDYRIFEQVLELAPGDHVVEVLAQNLSRKKRGILDRLRKRPLSAGTRILLRVPDLTREPALGDPVFEVGHGTRSPYASRLYGLLNDSLHVRVGLFAHGPHLVRATAIDRKGEVVWRDSMQVDASGERDVAFDTSVNTLPAGQFTLGVTATGAAGAASVARSFDVAWSLVTWKASRHDIDVEAELVLTESRYKTYRALPVGEKERYLEDFWRSLDPTPDTARNQVREEFTRRLAFADLSFSEGVRGALTDRGRVFVHFGVPEELQSEVVPGHLANKGAEEALTKVDDVFTASEHKREDNWDTIGPTHGVSPWDRALSQQERNRVIGPAHEVTSYELWLYKGGGAPLFPEDRAVTVDTGLRLLFVDLTGFGEYRLRKSSVRLPIRGLTVEF